MRQLIFKAEIAKQNIQNKAIEAKNKVVEFIENEEGGEEWIGSAIKIAVIFIISAIILALLIFLFGDSAIGGWMKKTVSNWFPTAGETRPSV
ncbi:DUF6133 family protein [Paludicola sp. MB14-C6]|uniref:DUF6133 family protein n=1 Tax=Paludihabitans sp. MB14-C6 TaxID=3070656 RepID=UPI0027DCCAFF|nr:DUF6133 family protein [Paludicola sp. MB14-C6]WMJ22695.1 DUF6133 family protein [Paludicola sp. MB14-C6]